MKYPYLILSAFLLITSTISAQESVTPAPADVMQKVIHVVDNIKSCHYTAQMRTQDMGSDTFDTRDFVINLRRNEDNLLYGYDWEIGERKNGYSFTFMIVPGYSYRMHSGARFISRINMLSRFEPGEYFWTMHDYFILDEVIKEFRIAADDHATITETEDAFQLTRQMNKWAKLDLFVDNKSFLPVRSVSTITDGDLDLKQIIAIDFNFPDIYNQLPDSAFLPGYCMSKGYELKTFEAATTESEEAEFTLDEIKEALLLSYPFITGVGDTIHLIDVQNKYVLLDFWFASCLPCLQAMPHVNQLSERYRVNGLQVFGVNCFDSDIRSSLTAKLKAKGITMPFLFGERELVNSLGMKAFPTYIFITPDKDFRIISGSADDIQALLIETFGR